MLSEKQAKRERRILEAQGRRTFLALAVKPEASIAIDHLMAEQTSHLNKLRLPCSPKTQPPD
jgi:hypothetical protein